MTEACHIHSHTIMCYLSELKVVDLMFSFLFYFSFIFIFIFILDLELGFRVTSQSIMGCMTLSQVTVT